MTDTTTVSAPTLDEQGFDRSLEPEVLTDKDETKEVPCRSCHRPCVVTRFMAAGKVECSACREAPAATPEFDESLETEVLTDAEQTKELPCVDCGRRCVVTLFAAPSKVKCNTCRGAKHKQHKQEVQIKAAHTVDPATLENLKDALINPVFRTEPVCPFDPEHETELKSVVHSPNYGPRHLLGYDGRGMPRYEQQTGESVVYQCNTCHTTISYSTMHPVLLQAQNEARQAGKASPGVLEHWLGARAGDSDNFGGDDLPPG